MSGQQKKSKQIEVTLSGALNAPSAIDSDRESTHFDRSLDESTVAASPLISANLEHTTSKSLRGDFGNQVGSMIDPEMSDDFRSRFDDPMRDPFGLTQQLSPIGNPETSNYQGYTTRDDLPGEPEFAPAKSVRRDHSKLSVVGFVNGEDFGSRDQGTAAIGRSAAKSATNTRSNLFASNGSQLTGFTEDVNADFLRTSVSSPDAQTNSNFILPSDGKPGWQPGLAAAAVVKPPSRIRGARFGSVYVLFRWFGICFLAAACALATLALVGPYMMSQEEMESVSSTLGVSEAMIWVGALEDRSSIQTLPVVDIQPPQPAVVRRTGASKGNQDYFSQIENAVALGDPSLAIANMRKAPPDLLSTPEDLDLAAKVSGRFFLLVGNTKRAEMVLETRCKLSREDLSIALCLPLARAYVGLGKIDKASQLMNRLESRRDAGEWKDVLTHVRTAIKTRQDLNPVTVAAHLSYLLDQASGNVEWERQQGLWIAQEVGLLGNRRWRDFALQIFELSRPEIEAKLFAGEAIGNRLRDTQVLTRLLDWLAARYGFQPFAFEHGQKFLPTNDLRLATVLQYLVNNEDHDSQGEVVGLHKLRGRAPFSEIERLLSVNAAVQEEDWDAVFHILSGQMTKLPKAQFSFEWKLIGALYAINTDDTGMAGELFRAIDRYAALDPAARETFDYWYIMARLANFLREDPQIYLGEARSRASGPRELGLVESIGLEFQAQRAGQSEALNIDRVVQNFPWHDRVLQSAIVASGWQGRDPKRFIEMQSRLSPERFIQGREKNLLLDATIEELILNL